MSTIMHYGRQDVIAVALATLTGGGAFVFRQLAIVPRATVGLCAATPHPAYCVPRALVLHWQYLGSFGLAALAAGIIAFMSGSRVVCGLAVGLGIAGVVNYNGTQSVIGAALGLIAWLSLLTGRWRGKPRTPTHQR